MTELDFHHQMFEFLNSRIIFTIILEPKQLELCRQVPGSERLQLKKRVSMSVDESILGKFVEEVIVAEEPPPFSGVFITSEFP